MRFNHDQEREIRALIRHEIQTRLQVFVPITPNRATPDTAVVNAEYVGLLNATLTGALMGSGDRLDDVLTFIDSRPVVQVRDATYDASAHELVVNADALTGSGWLMVMRTPGDIDYDTANALSVRFNTGQVLLLDRDGANVSALQLSRDRLYMMAAFPVSGGSVRLYLVDELEERKQDWNILCAYSEDGTFSEAEWLAGTSNDDGSDIESPPYAGTANALHVGFAVPADTPDVTEILAFNNPNFNLFQAVSPNPVIGGVEHSAWVSYVAQGAAFLPQYVWAVEQAR